MKPLSYDFEKSLGAAVISTARRLQVAMTAALEPHGSTYAQWTVLALLVRRGALHQREVAERLGLEASTVCRVLDGMQERGWLDRAPCPVDGRRKLVVLGSKVEPVREELRALAHGVRRRALRGIDRERQAELLELLGRVRSSLTPVHARERGGAA